MSHELIRENRLSNYERLEIEGKTVWVPLPAGIPAIQYIEREDILERAMAAWLRLNGVPPLNFRLYGPPGGGKNTVVYRLAQILKKDLYIINGHEELGPEDVACSATMTSRNTIEYVASPIFAAMLRGGICFFDEIGKAPVSALDPLAPVLDDRRTLSSVLAGIRLRAHEDFLFCAALNQDEEEGIGLPGFIDERTRPAIHVGYPAEQTLERILKSHLPMAAETWFKVFLKEFRSSKLSPRTAITLIGYAYRMFVQDGSGAADEERIAACLRKAHEDMEKVSLNRSVDGDGGRGGAKGGKDDVEIRLGQTGRYQRDVQ